MGTLDATAEEGDRDLGKTLGVAFTIICFLGLLAVMLMCLSGKGRLSKGTTDFVCLFVWVLHKRNYIEICGAKK